MAKATQVAAQKASLEAITQATAAWLIGRTSRFIRDNDPPRNDDGTYNAASVVEWFVTREATAATGDPLLVGDSPSLERYRAAKAELAEMDAAERRGQLVDVGQLIEWWHIEVAAPIKAAIKSLDDAGAAVMSAALEKAIEAVTKREPTAEPTEATDTVATTD